MKNILILFLCLPFTVHCQDTLYDKSGKPAYIKYEEVIPIPPVVYTNIDNIDTKIVYSGTWVNGPTTATGFYPSPPNSTIAYSNLAGNTSTLIFTGTSIEVFCEKKVGHGSGAFQVDNQLPVTIPLGVAGPVGSTSVYKVENLPQGQHTFKLTVVGSGNVVFDYVKIDGQAVIPPVSEYIFLTPGVSAKLAIESASSGTKFQLGNGVYPETTINVPVGVSIYPPVSGTAYFEAVHAAPVDAATRDVAIFQLKSGSRVNGNQTISGFTVRGKFTATGGIIVDNRDNVIIDKVIVNDCNFSGVWIRNSTGSTLSNSEITNSSWASTGWVSGEVNVGGVLIGVEIHHNKISNNKIGANGLSSKGYGIKALYKDGTYNCKIYSNIITLPPTSLWNNGQSPNISIEFNQATPDGIEIYDNEVNNMISMACYKPTKSGRIWLHNNRYNLQPGSTAHVEAVCSNLTVENEIMRGAPMIAANFQPNGKWNDQVFNNIDFVSNNANPSWGGTFLIGPDGVTNVVYKNSKITKGNYTLVKYMGVTGGVSDGGGNVMN